MNRICAALAVTTALALPAVPATSSARSAAPPGAAARDLGGRVTYLVPPKNRHLSGGALAGDGNGRFVAAWNTGTTTSIRWHARHERWSKAARFAAGDGVHQQQATFVAGGSPLVVWSSETLTPRCRDGEDTCPIYLRYSTHSARGWSHPHNMGSESPYTHAFDLLSNISGDAALVSWDGVNFFTDGQWSGLFTGTGYGEFFHGTSTLDSRGRAVVVRWVEQGGQNVLEVERVSSDTTTQTWSFPTSGTDLLGLPTLAADKSGDVELAWRTWDGIGVNVWTSTLSDAGDLSAPRSQYRYVTSQTGASPVGTCTALASDGRAVFAWHSFHAVHAVYRDSHGNLGGVTSFLGRRDSGCSSVAFPKSGGAWMLFHVVMCSHRGHSCAVRYRVTEHSGTGPWAAPRTVATRGLKPAGAVLTGPDGRLTFPLFRRGSYFAALTTTVSTTARR